MEALTNALSAVLGQTRTVDKFEHLTPTCSVNFQNERYQDRAVNAAYGTFGYVEKTGDQYMMSFQFPTIDADYSSNYQLHGNDNVQLIFAITVPGSPLTILISDTWKMQDIKAFIGSKLTEVSIDVMMRQFKSDTTKYQATIYLDRVKNSLLINKVDVKLPVSVCDDWYVRLVRFVSQKSIGPVLPAGFSV